MSRSSRTLYVGNLPGDVREKEVDDLFYKYGPIAHIDLKIPPRPPGYAFVEFEEARDAEDAIRGRDGYDFDGHRLRVELAHGGRGYSSTVDRHSSHGGGGGGRRGGVSRRSDYRVLITGLPSNASWQDLKDHMRRAGDVCFSQVFHNKHGRGTHGIVDYTNMEDMKYAIRKLDDSEFKNAFGRKVIRVEEYRGSPRGGSRSPSYSRARSYSRSPSRSRSRSRSRDRSYSRSISPRSPKVDKSRDSRAKHRSKSVSSRSPSRSRSPLPRSLYSIWHFIACAYFTMVQKYSHLSIQNIICKCPTGGNGLEETVGCNGPKSSLLLFVFPGWGWGIIVMLCNNFTEKLLLISFYQLCCLDWVGEWVKFYVFFVIASCESCMFVCLDWIFAAKRGSQMGSGLDMSRMSGTLVSGVSARLGIQQIMDYHNRAGLLGTNG